jgi:hypothetical protein
MTTPVRGWAMAAFLLALSGCGAPPAAPTGTGAREAVKTFYEGLMHQDWQQAYGVLDADSQSNCSREDFSRRAGAFYASLGFPPDELHIRTCDERGTEAISRVVLAGRKDAHTLRHNAGVTLRRSDDGWRVLLPANFGATP